MYGKYHNSLVNIGTVQGEARFFPSVFLTSPPTSLIKSHYGIRVLKKR